MTSFKILLQGSVAALLTAASAHGALLAYDGFDYTAGTDNLGGSAGGSGWATAGTTAWTGTVASGPTEEVQAPGSNYPNLATTGNKAFLGAVGGTTAASFREVPADIGTDAWLTGGGSATVWVSFIGQRTGTDLVRFYSLSFFLDGINAANERFSIGENSANNNNAWGMHFTSSGSSRVDILTAPITTETLLLARIDFASAANDSIYLWANYDLTLGEPAIATAQVSNVAGFNLAFDRLALRAGGSNASGPVPAQGFFDEVRLGETYADVTPIPEPAMIGIIGTAAMLAIGGWRRQRAAR